MGTMHDYCLVRQPVFAAKGTLLGYEIRFRDSEDGRHAFTQSFLSGTFDMVRGQFPAFLACSRAQLLENAFQIVDPKNAILLLPSQIEADDEVVAAVERFCASGGSIALDDINEDRAPAEALLPYASWVRVDIRVEDPVAIGRVCDRVSQTGAARAPRLVADHVYESAQYELAQGLQFDAYQGAFFSRPEPLPAADLPQSTVAAMRLLGMSRDTKVSDRELEDVLETDPVLTFQLLRLVNSAAVGMRGVSSIGQALRLIGRNAFQRWLAVAVAASRRSKTGVDQELVRQAVERGRLLEQLAGGPRDGGTLFLVGLFSLLDGVFRMPLQEILSRVVLSDDANRALLHREGPYADALGFAEAYELGLFEHASELARAMGVDATRIGEFYTQAVAWTNDALSPELVNAA
jgi:EAL and modified HD-GYP domain-containing signal transduction protein